LVLAVEHVLGRHLVDVPADESGEGVAAPGGERAREALAEARREPCRRRREVDARDVGPLQLDDAAPGGCDDDAPAGGAEVGRAALQFDLVAVAEREQGPVAPGVLQAPQVPEPDARLAHRSVVVVAEAEAQEADLAAAPFAAVAADDRL